jgi:ubiquinone/menaquinone biosynthesis C-methylase UbiE
MVNIFLPSSKSRRKLAFIARHLNLAMSRSLRKNFSQPTQGGTAQLREFLIKSYFPSWYTGVDLAGFSETDEGRKELDDHLFRRLEMDRYGFIPWIDKLVTFAGSSVIEIGCGSGSAMVAMAEQGAEVIALDVHREALEASRLRARAHGVTNVSFIEGNAQNLKELVPDHKFDLIIFFAVLEHMTFAERKNSLRAAWEILPRGKHICITDTPNRLWFFDGHTSGLPFFHWLPDEVAFEYSQLSSRYPFNSRFHKVDSEAMLSFVRDGRGISFHDIDLALGTDCGYRIVSDLTSFISMRNPVMMLKRLLAGDGGRERLLNSYAPGLHRGFFRQQLNLIIQKL